MKIGLKEDFQAQLHGTRSTGTKHRIGAEYIGRCGAEAETCARVSTWIGIRIVAPRASERIGKVGVVEYVEELGPNLDRQALLDLENLGHIQVHVVIRE